MLVTIRPLVEADANTSVIWRNDPEVFRYTGNTYGHTITLDSELNWIRKVIANPSDYRCAILADGIYVGNIYLTDIADGAATYHIFLGNRDYWGRGVAARASRLIIDYGFQQLGLHTIKLKVRKQNIRAVRLYTSLGFTVSGEENDWLAMSLHNSKNQ